MGLSHTPSNGEGGYITVFFFVKNVGWVELFLFCYKAVLILLVCISVCTFMSEIKLSHGPFSIIFSVNNCNVTTKLFI